MSSNEISYWSNTAAYQIIKKCEELMLFRPRISDKEEFARYVMNNLFGQGTLDLLSLCPNFDETHAEALNRLNGLIGFESAVFKIIYSNDLLFEDFIRIFTQHAINSRTAPNVVANSIYTWLLGEYLSHILPIDDRKLNVLRNSNWLVTPSIASHYNTMGNSQRKLSRTEAIAAIANTNFPVDYGVRSASLRSLYPRLVQFLGGVIGGLASMNTWPSIAQCEVLRITLKHYIDFILRDTEDNDLVSLILFLTKKSLFVAPLQRFLHRLLINWPLDSSYYVLIDLWRTLTHHPSLEVRNEEKRNIFIESTAQHYAGCFELIVQRIVESDCLTMLQSKVLDQIENCVFQERFYHRLFAEHGMSCVDYLNEILHRLVTFCDEQKVLVGTKDTDGIGTKVARFIFNLSNHTGINVELAERHVQTIQRILCSIQKLGGGADTADLSMLNDSDGRGRTGPSSSTPFSTPKLISANRVGDWCEVSAITTATSDGIDTSTCSTSVFEKSNQDGDDALRRAADNADVLAKAAIPDHDVDPWTKLLYLTPAGRKQVINRRSRFDFKSCSRQIADTFPYIRQWEIPLLARWLHNLSVQYSDCRLVKYLKFHRNDSFINRKLADALLSAPSPPRYVPVFSRTVPQHPSRLNLRIFASVPFIVVLSTILYLFYFLIHRIFF